MKNNLKLFILLITSLSLGSISITSFAVYQGPSFFAGGDGGQNSPYQIETCEQLQNINEFAGENYYFILNNDIDCSDTINWNEGKGFMPIGVTIDVGDTEDNEDDIGYGNPFVGNFDGNNKTISNLHINRPNFVFVGLFGLVDGNNETIIKNLNILNANIKGFNTTGILAGTIMDSEISNIHTSGGVTSINNEHLGNVGTGGNIGYLSGSILNNSSSSASINGIDMVGGLVGNSQYSHIENTYSTGNVNGSNRVGGLIGYLIDDNCVTCNQASTVVNSYATGNVVGNEEVGGLVGYVDADKIINSYSTGNVTGNDRVGGFVGYIDEGNNSEKVSNYIINSGWYKSAQNSNLPSIGATWNRYSDEEKPDTSYTETNASAFYSKDHNIYSGQEYEWGFDGNPWYEHNNDYPKFIKQIQIEKPRIISSGSSRSSISLFKKQQQALLMAAQITAQQDVDNTNCLSGYVYNPISGNLCPVSNKNQKFNNDDFSNNSILDLNSNRKLMLLTPRMVGKDILYLQTYLNKEGYYNGLIDGVFGSGTEQSVIEFQKEKGLSPDGRVGPITRSYLK